MDTAGPNQNKCSPLENILDKLYMASIIFLLNDNQTHEVTRFHSSGSL